MLLSFKTLPSLHSLISHFRRGQRCQGNKGAGNSSGAASGGRRIENILVDGDHIAPRSKWIKVDDDDDDDTPE